MQPASISGASSASLMQQLLNSLRVNAASTRQDAPAGDAVSAEPSWPPPGPPPGPPPPKPQGSDNDRFSSDTLSSLFAAQSDPSAADVASALLADVDADGSGGLSLDEVTSALTSNGRVRSGDDTGGTADAFAALDSDGDGALNAGELETGLRSALADRPPPPRGFGPPEASDVAAQILKATDGDASGGLSLDELTTALKADASADGDAVAQAFSTLDANGDGSLDAQELASALQNLAPHRHQHEAYAVASSATETQSTALNATA